MKAILKLILKPIKNVNVYETKYPERNNLYFCASDLEFSPISIINWRKT